MTKQRYQMFLAPRQGGRIVEVARPRLVTRLTCDSTDEAREEALKVTADLIGPDPSVPAPVMAPAPVTALSA